MEPREPELAIFSHRITELMGPALPVVASADPARDAAQLLAGAEPGDYALVERGGRIVGTLAAPELLRALAEGGGARPVGDLMQPPVPVLAAGDPLWRALATLLGSGCDRLPVAWGERRVGSLALASLVPALTPLDAALLARLADPEQPRPAQVELVRALLSAAVPVAAILDTLTRLNRELARRLLEHEVEALAEQGWGRPPATFELIVMGSGGRRENLLVCDQDHGLILADYPDRDHPAVDAYFAELARRVSDGLARVGIGYCPGHVMASNPLWRKSLTQWAEQINGWMRRPALATLRLADIFFDFAPLEAGGEMAARLRRAVTDAARRSHLFLSAMRAVQEGHRVALGPLGRLLPDPGDPARRHQINLKHHALLPLVEGVRLLALRAGVDATATRERLTRLETLAVLADDEAGYLREAHSNLVRLLLREQLRLFDAGIAPGYHVALDGLSTREREQLANDLAAIERLRAKIRFEFTGELA